MQLRKARVCLDCEEVHDLDACPVCASEAFAYLTQWLKVEERRKRKRVPAEKSGAHPHLQPIIFGSGILGVIAFSLFKWSRSGVGSPEHVADEQTESSRRHVDRIASGE